MEACNYWAQSFGPSGVSSVLGLAIVLGCGSTHSVISLLFLVALALNGRCAPHAIKYIWIDEVGVR